MKRKLLEDELKEKLSKGESSGKLYRALLEPGEGPYFKMVLKLPKDIEQSWKDILSWSDFWRQPKKDRQGHPLWRIEEKGKTIPGFGKQTLPVRLFVDTPGEAFQLLGLTEKQHRFEKLWKETKEKEPALLPWVLKYFNRIDEEGFYPLYFPIATFMKHKALKTEGYLREWSIPGVDTKFLETHQFLTKSLWNALFPENQVGSLPELLEKLFVENLPVPRICVRSLDETQNFCGVSKLFLSQDEIAHFQPAQHRIFITENKVNGYTFPMVKDSLILFGMGYGVLELAEAATWLADKEIYYWGDLDHDGFNILSNLRKVLPEMQIHSFLMDKETLLAYVDPKVKDTGNTTTIPDHLTVSEKMAWKLIHDNGWRLEQERIPHEEVEWAVESLLEDEK